MRWLLALHGDTPIPFSYGPLLAAPTTRVLRNDDRPQRAVASAEAYEGDLAAAGITLALDERREAIWAAAQAAAAEVGAPCARVCACCMCVHALVHACVSAESSASPTPRRLLKTSLLVPLLRSHRSGVRSRRPAGGICSTRCQTWWRAPPWCGAPLTPPSSSCQSEPPDGCVYALFGV